MQATRTYLELTDRSQLVPSLLDDPGIRIDRVAGCPPSFYRYLYSHVGGQYRWIDRLQWSDEMVDAHLGTPGVSLWVMYRERQTADLAASFGHILVDDL